MKNKLKTMHKEYGEPKDELGEHLVCSKCGLCIPCGDCKCEDDLK